MRGSASISSGSLGIVTESRMAGVQTLLVSVLFALAAAGCGGGQGREAPVVVMRRSLSTTNRYYRTVGGNSSPENSSSRKDVYARRHPLEAAKITDRH